MVYHCVAAGCSNTTGGNITLHKFPSDKGKRAKWIQQVQRTRAQWTATQYSFLCSEHFTQDCFEVESLLASSFGLKKKRRLKPDAIPTIFHRVPAAAVQTREAQKRPSSTSVTGESLPKKKRGAVEKRERARVRNRLYINEIHRS